MTSTKKNTRATTVPGIGRSASTDRFMSVSAAWAHKKTAIAEGTRRKKDK
ncbi:MAG: hypothetical protein ABI432_08545 [Flavobacteriales bacterium]